MEIKRIFWKKKLLAAAAGILALNLFLILKTETGWWGGTIADAGFMHRAAWQAEKVQIPVTEEGELYRQYLDYLEQNQEEGVSYRQSYPAYLREVQDHAASLGGIGIFAEESGATAENLRKTSADYQQLETIVPEDGNDLLWQRFFLYSYHSYLALLFSCIVVLSMSKSDQELEQILYACKNGKGRRQAKQLMAVALVGTGYFFLLYTETFLTAVWLYGGDVSGRMIQSVPGYGDAMYTVTIEAFAVINAVLLTIAVLFIAFLLILLRNVLNNDNAAVFVILVLLAAGLAAERLFSDSNVMAWTRYLNLWYPLKITDMFRDYRNLQIAGRVIDRYSAEIIFILSGTVLSAAVTIIFREKVRPCRKKLRILQYAESVSAKIRRVWYHAPWFLNESRKMLLWRYGLLLLIAVAGYMVAAAPDGSLFYAEDVQFYRSICEQYGNRPVSEELLSTLEQQEEAIRQVQEEYETAKTDYMQGKIGAEEFLAYYNRYTNYEKIAGGTALVRQQVDYLQKLQNEKGIDGYFIEETGYEALLGTQDAGQRMTTGLYALLLIVLMSVSAFPLEKDHGMMDLLRSLPGGRKEFLREKRRAIQFQTMLVAITIYGIEFWQMYSMYEWEGWTAPVQSLSWCYDFPVQLTVWSVVLLCYIVRYLLLASVAQIVMCSSLFLPQELGIILGLAVFYLPGMLGMRQLIFLRDSSCAYILSVTLPVLEHSAGYELGAALILVLTSAAVWSGTKRYWKVEKAYEMNKGRV